MGRPRPAVSDIPAHLRKFLPEQPPEPTPAEKFDAWLAQNGPETDANAERWRVRSSSSEPRTWIGFVVSVGIGLAVIAVLAWGVP